MKKEEKERLYELVEKGLYDAVFRALDAISTDKTALNEVRNVFLFGRTDANYHIRVRALIDAISTETPSFYIEKRETKYAKPTLTPAMLWVGLILLLFLGYLASFHPVFNKPVSDEKQVLKTDTIKKVPLDSLGKEFTKNISSWKGIWVCNVGCSSSNKVQHELSITTIDKNTFSGTYDIDAVSGSISGFVKDNGKLLEGNWLQINGRKGKFEFRLDKESVFKGIYNVNNSLPWCEWNGTKKN